MTTEKIRNPGDHWISTTCGISGYFAVELWLNPDGMFEPFVEPWSTGMDRYKTKEEAVEEAKQWAEEEGMEYQE